MGRYKVGLIIPHPEDQKWDSVWKLFRMPSLNLPTLAAFIPENEWDIEIQDEIVGPLDFTRDYDLVLRNRLPIDSPTRRKSDSVFSPIEWINCVPRCNQDHEFINAERATGLPRSDEQHGAPIPGTICG